MRRKLLPENYQLLLNDLHREGLLTSSAEKSLSVDEKVMEQAHYDRFMEIIEQYEIRRFNRILGPAAYYEDLFRLRDLYSNLNEQDE